MATVEAYADSFLIDSGLLLSLLQGPLHPSLGIPAVQIATSTAGDLLILTVEEPDRWLFGLDVGFQPSDQDGRERDIMVFFTLALPDMQHLSIKIKVEYLDVADFKTAKAAPI